MLFIVIEEGRERRRREGERGKGLKREGNRKRKTRRIGRGGREILSLYICPHTVL